MSHRRQVVDFYLNRNKDLNTIEGDIVEKSAFWNGFEKQAVSMGWIRNKIISGSSARGAKFSHKPDFLKNVGETNKRIAKMEEKLPSKVRKGVREVKPLETRHLDIPQAERKHLHSLVREINKGYRA